MGNCRPSIRQSLARNVKALMDRTPSLGSNAKLAAACHTATRRIGASTIQHLVNVDGPQPQLDTIVAVAEAFGVAPSALLMRDFDPETKSARELPAPEVIALARRIGELPADKQDLLMQLFGEAVTDDDLHGNGITPPTQPPVIHEPARPYEGTPKQLKIRPKR